MKTISIFIIRLIFIIFFALAGTASIAQEPPPPPPDHGDSGNVPGGGSDLTGGIAILLALGAGYAGKKIYGHRKRKLSS